MNKYLEHPPVEAPFWDISNKLKYFGSSKGEFIKRKFAVEMSLLSYMYVTSPLKNQQKKQKIHYQPSTTVIVQLPTAINDNY